MAKEKKKTILRHEHPIYPWVALVVSVSVIFALLGWLYLAM